MYRSKRSYQSCVLMFSWLQEEFPWLWAWLTFNCLCLVMWNWFNEANRGHVVLSSSLSGAPLGHLSSSVSAVSFIKPQRRDQDTHRTYLHGSEDRQTALCVCVWYWGICMRVGGPVTCGSVAQSWSLVLRLPAFGQKTSNQPTAECEENTKRENVWKTCDRRKLNWEEKNRKTSKATKEVTSNRQKHPC